MSWTVATPIFPTREKAMLFSWKDIHYRRRGLGTVDTTGLRAAPLGG